MSRFCNTFDQTLKHYRIKAVELSERAGVSSGLISDFRNDRKATTTDTLEKILEAMEELAPGSSGYFHSQMAGSKNLVDLKNKFQEYQNLHLLSNFVTHFYLPCS